MIASSSKAFSVEPATAKSDIFVLAPSIPTGVKSGWKEFRTKTRVISNQLSVMVQPGETLRHAKSFRDLVVYEKARQLARDVYDITKRLPAGEAFSLTDQWRRASRSRGQ